MIPVTSLRNGACFADGNDLLQVLNYEHVKLGRGTATIKIKTKNLKTGATVEKVFISGAKVQEAVLEKREVQYLYKTISFVFMDPVTFDQFELSPEKVADQGALLKEGMTVKVVFYKNEPLGIELPIKLDLAVAETGPEIRGNSATNIFKDAIMENGLKVRVPIFVKVGDKVSVDTRTGEYKERVCQ